MNYSTDIWSEITHRIELIVQQLPAASYGFFIHGLYIFGLALVLCRLSSQGRTVAPALNWFWLVLAFVVGPKIPVVVPESVTLKSLLLAASVAVIVLVPTRLCVYLSWSEKQRRQIQTSLIALLVVVFIINQIFRGGP